MGPAPIQALRQSRSQSFARPPDVVDPAIYFVEKPPRCGSIVCVFRLVSHPDRLTPFQQDDRVLTLDPNDWKPMSSVGAGVREIRIRDESGAFRVMYVVQAKDAVYVLHAFQKKSQQTARHDLDLARLRLQQV
ncbi:type II toxin-antitoxin system RelE/ParE family toxin [Rhizobium oryzicola]|uniref:Type II toxin-antitoxin system RelE/ParE family toxin n=1 Tax=Rhizobium oryzicola TaxID=1232668 RepID=A0ABT8SSK2_9HYPH|nr:type II toxin-antitoxin system RelE/ParE family toxin [Rhizobium oryzicola]MDO1581394.1 type II toxin-antitoxin system RelE/ParE family toxin [Rhizobium oryzicola]